MLIICPLFWNFLLRFTAVQVIGCVPFKSVGYECLRQQVAGSLLYQQHTVVFSARTTFRVYIYILHNNQ